MTLDAVFFAHFSFNDFVKLDELVHVFFPKHLNTLTVQAAVSYLSVPIGEKIEFTGCHCAI